VTLGSLSANYNGSPHSATATTSPGGLAVTFTYAAARLLRPTPAATPSWNDQQRQLPGQRQWHAGHRQGSPGDHLAGSGGDHLSKGVVGDTAQCHGQRAGRLYLCAGAGTVLGAGTQTLHVTFTPTDATDYTTPTATQTLTVNKATPVITWPAPAAITYPRALSATQLNATASVPGTFVYSPRWGRC